MKIIKKLLTTSVVLGAMGLAAFGGTASASASTVDGPKATAAEAPRGSATEKKADSKLIDDLDEICLVKLPDGSLLIGLCDDEGATKK